MNIYLFSLLSKFGIAGLGIVASILINRFLGPSLKGEYAYVLNVVNLATIVLNLGIYQSYPFFKRQDSRDIKDRYFTVSILQFALYLALGLAFALVLGGGTAVIFTLTPLMILSRQVSFITLVEDINRRNRASLLNQIYYTAALATIYFTGQPGLMPVFALLYLKEALLVVVLSWRFEFHLMARGLSRDFVLKVLRFGFFPMLSGLLITFNYNIDIIILKLYVDFEQIGFYSVGVSLANQVWLIPDAFKDVIFKMTAERDSVREISLSVKLNLYISILIVLFLVVFGEWLIGLLIGRSFLPSYQVTVVTVAGVLPMIFFKMIQPLFNAVGKQTLSFVILLLSAVSNVAINFVFIPVYGIMGAAMTSIFSYVVSGLLFAYFFMRDYHVRARDFFLFSKEEIRLLTGLFRRGGGKPG